MKIKVGFPPAFVQSTYYCNFINMQHVWHSGMFSIGLHNYITLYEQEK